MEWTITAHKFVGAEFFTVSTPIPPMEGFEAGNRGRHSIMIEWLDRQQGWVVRDACGSGVGSPSLLKAIKSYIEISRYANRGKVGFCGTMIDEILPSLEDQLGDLINQVLGLYAGTHNLSEN